MRELDKVGRLGLSAGGETNFTYPAGTALLIGRLYTRLIKKDQEPGLLTLQGEKQVTTEFLNHLGAILAGGALGYFGLYKYHISGTGTDAETATDACNDFEDKSAAHIGTQSYTGLVYTSVGTINYTSTLVIAEHGLTADDGGESLLMDRTKLGSTQGVDDGDSIEFTYTLTLAGS